MTRMDEWVQIHFTITTTYGYTLTLYPCHTAMYKPLPYSYTAIKSRTASRDEFYVRHLFAQIYCENKKFT